jgi:hypothetical protein
MFGPELPARVGPRDRPGVLGPVGDEGEEALRDGGGTGRIVDATNSVLGRPNQARIEWTFDEPSMVASFRTVEAKFTDNSARYQVEPSPDGLRSRMTTVYHPRDKGGHRFPLHSLKLAIQEGYVAAVRRG